MSSYSQETIVAIATPPGRGGIGVVRVSGPLAQEIGGALLRVRQPLLAGRARFGYLLDPDTNGAEAESVLDEVVATFYAGPKSYTGEDVLEIATHGAPVVLDAVLRGAMRQGARLAEPGEFTQRAFLSGRLDLTQAEGVHDLVNATTLHQARVAAGQIGGSLSREIRPVKAQLISLIATLEAGVDFAEDDLEVLPQEALSKQLAAIAEPLRRLERTFGYGRAVREGLTLAIVGRPNAGKSSLFNALLQRDRSIVTATPGTTRDAITERIAFAGVPVEVTDTAGLREATDEIEALGIARSHEALAEAALVVIVVDGTRELEQADVALLDTLHDRAAVVVLNKSDAATEPMLSGLAEALGEKTGAAEVVMTSARTGAGVEKLREAIAGRLLGGASMQDTGLVTNARQHEAVTAACAALEAAREATEVQLPHEMVLLDLHTALDGLDALTGRTTAEEILHLIFSTFCIGK